MTRSLVVPKSLSAVVGLERRGLRTNPPARGIKGMGKPAATPATKPATGPIAAELAQRRAIAAEVVAEQRQLEEALGPNLAKFAFGLTLKKSNVK